MEDLRVDGGEVEGDISGGIVEGVLESEVEGVSSGRPLETSGIDVVSSTEYLLEVGSVGCEGWMVCGLELEDFTYL